MRLILCRPDIPQNVGASIRVAACFGAGVDVVAPCGFAGADREIRRVAMDYGLLAPPVFHASWSAFALRREDGRRLILMTTKGDRALYDHRFAPDDSIILGSESAGAADDVHAAADIRLAIAIAPGARSLNVAVAGAVALAEARRQLGWGSGAGPRSHGV